jgi:superfamily I DNA and/or RNA helicase
MSKGKWLKNNKRMLQWAINYLIKKGEIAKPPTGGHSHLDIINCIEKSTITDLDKKMNGAWRKYESIRKTTDKKQQSYNLSNSTIEDLKILNQYYTLQSSATIERIIRDKCIQETQIIINKQSKNSFNESQSVSSVTTENDKLNIDLTTKIEELQTYIDQLLPNYCKYKVICESGGLSEEDLDNSGKKEIEMLFEEMTENR